MLLQITKPWKTKKKTRKPTEKRLKGHNGLTWVEAKTQTLLASLRLGENMHQTRKVEAVQKTCSERGGENIARMDEGGWKNRPSSGTPQGVLGRQCGNADWKKKGDFKISRRRRNN